MTGSHRLTRHPSKDDSKLTASFEASKKTFKSMSNIERASMVAMQQLNSFSSRLPEEELRAIEQRLVLLQDPEGSPWDPVLMFVFVLSKDQRESLAESFEQHISELEDK